MLKTDDELKQESLIKIKWAKEKRYRGMSLEESGKKLPREIKIMLINSLLRDLKIDVEIGRHG